MNRQEWYMSPGRKLVYEPDDLILLLGDWPGPRYLDALVIRQDEDPDYWWVSVGEETKRVHKTDMVAFVRPRKESMASRQEGKKTIIANHVVLTYTNDRDGDELVWASEDGVNWYQAVDPDFEGETVVVHDDVVLGTAQIKMHSWEYESGIGHPAFESRRAYGDSKMARQPKNLKLKSEAAKRVFRAATRRSVQDGREKQEGSDEWVFADGDRIQVAVGARDYVGVRGQVLHELGAQNGHRLYYVRLTAPGHGEWDVELLGSEMVPVGQWAVQNGLWAGESRAKKQERVISSSCPFCGKNQSVEVDDADYARWQSGTFVQDAFPYLSVDEREALQTGICPACWDEHFFDDDASSDWTESKKQAPRVETGFGDVSGVRDFYSYDEWEEAALQKGCQLRSSGGRRSARDGEVHWQVKGDTIEAISPGGRLVGEWEPIDSEGWLYK